MHSRAQKKIKKTEIKNSAMTRETSHSKRHFPCGITAAIFLKGAPTYETTLS